MNLYHLFLLPLLFLICSMSAIAEKSYVVEIYEDKESIGSAYKISDYAFRVETTECKIVWHAVTPKKGNPWLDIDRYCDRSFDEHIDIHRAILKAINNKFSLSQFDHLAWGGLCSTTDWSWCIPIARASLTSEDYIDYWQNYPNSKLKSSNSHFVDLANKENVYKSLSTVFSEYGIKAELVSVEKVFAQRINKTPFYSELKHEVGDKNPRVMYDVGMSVFKLTPKTD